MWRLIFRQGYSSVDYLVAEIVEHANETGPFGTKQSAYAALRAEIKRYGASRYEAERKAASPMSHCGIGIEAMQ